MTKIFIGNAKKCWEEAQELEYAYFSPDLDLGAFDGSEIKVADILFKVI